MKRTQLLMNKPGYSGLSILQISKMIMYQFWYDYMTETHILRESKIMLHRYR